MKFSKFKNSVDEGWKRHRNKYNKRLSQQERDRYYQLYANWSLLETNKNLVYVTWMLAIATLFLALLSICD